LKWTTNMYVTGSRLLLVAGLLLALPANAEDAERTVPPYPYTEGWPEKPVIIRLVPDEEIQTICYASRHQRRMMACTYLNTKDCTIYMSDFLAHLPNFNGTLNLVEDPEGHNGLYMKVLNHEMAHCRGWPADHPDK
jgi:hypothetical protein